MRICVFDDYRVGVIQGIDVVDVSSLIDSRWRCTPLAVNQFIEDFDGLRSDLKEGIGSMPRTSLEQVTLRPPVPRPRQLLAAPLNYRLHVDEMAASPHAPGGLPGEPSARELGFFVKASGSVCGPSDAIEVPDWPGRTFHHECELGVVIGKEARSVPRATALEHVFGYLCLIDVTLRMIGDHQEERAMRKSFHSFTPIGPYITTRDEVGDPSDLSLKLWVNGQQRQAASTAALIVGIPELIEQASRILPLFPGDIYATGTPEGVGPIVPGDRVRIWIDRVGEMQLPVIKRAW
jgi:2-keto-4-pentenoate hydratase/2-oxohepta-3-ene-1,7-dioic acid hydratase in catechol pathway